ncbi:glycerol-3-phosphate dehydrogenase 1-like protein [Balaenoptera musculus]|uniref:Glycerol-3-phosphate dehydrogenase [NAD(+)] n=1 Tax=Balaenoptera musculus TaxID=9771 RepID=A0A8B8YU69_BALMU|nr:glycerol-3-phosphate dehydrogenase 1-like protein [Balaenoptera musculus]
MEVKDLDPMGIEEDHEEASPAKPVGDGDAARVQVSPSLELSPGSSSREGWSGGHPGQPGQDCSAGRLVQPPAPGARVSAQPPGEARGAAGESIQGARTTSPDRPRAGLGGAGAGPGGQPGPGVRGGSREWRGGSSRLSAVALGARAGVVAAIGREAGGAGLPRAAAGSGRAGGGGAGRRRRAAGRGGARRSAAFRPGHGSGAPEVCIVGSGNWGSAVAKIIGDNVKKLQKFASTVKMWVFEETVNGRKLTDIINNDHENVKYLPGHKLPENVVAVANLSEAVQDADLLVFVIPHQFIHRICEEITGRVAKDALGITLIKGIDEGPEGLKLISDIIREKMGIDISVLMGANIANEVAAGKFCETTIGSKVMENGLLFKELLQTPNFRITVVDDADTVEVCGALKNIVAVGAGFCDGLRCGDNTKAAVIRLGLMEMIAFARIFCKGQVSTATFLESCGVADLITTCYGGRNRRVAEAFARTGKTIEELEKEMLNGQKLQGPQTSAEVYRILKQKGLLDKFPLFTAVYQICYEGRPVQEMLSCLQSHPEHI